jgi:hypothetical protein
MGGKAMSLYGIKTERKNTKDHLRIQDELILIISKMFNTEVKGIKFYHNKETHGDCDLLMLDHGNLGNVFEKLKKRFGIVHSNGGIFSFAYDNYQIDIILQTLQDWNCNSDYFDYDPSGNLMGKVAHKFGLKYGINGLTYPFRSFSGQLKTDIIISKDSKKIFEFLGFDYQRYLKGFDTLEEIYEYIINSKYFNPKGFMLNELNNVDRKRNKKRKTYRGFIEYINNRSDLPYFEYKEKDFYIDYIEEFFPESGFKKQLEDLKKENEKNKLASEKFNGHMIMQWCDLKGKELGDCLNKFKKYIGESLFREWVLNTDNIEDVFKKWFKMQ